MPLPQPAERQAIHTRRIECHGFRRADGLWDIEAHLVDTKAVPFPLRERGLLTPGEPLHDLWLRLTVDEELVIRDAQAASDSTPYASCGEVAPWYGRLVGLRIAPGWEREVRGLVGGVAGCTHLTELLRPLASAAVQTVRFSPAPREPEAAVLRQPPPALLDTCHSYDRTGSTVATHWPALHQPR